MTFHGEQMTTEEKSQHVWCAGEISPDAPRDLDQPRAIYRLCGVTDWGTAAWAAWQFRKCGHKNADVYLAIEALGGMYESDA